LRIAFFDEDLSPRTGSRRFTYEVASQLLRLGHKVDIFTTRLDKESCFRSYLSLPVHVLSGQLPFSMKRTKKGILPNCLKLSFIDVFSNLSYCLRQAKLVLQASERIAQLDYDALMVQYHGEHWLSPFFYYLNKPNGVLYLNVVPPAPRPVALSFQELTPPRKAADSLLDMSPVGVWAKTSFDKLGLFVTPSEFLLAQAHRQGIVGEKEAAVIPLGVNHSEFHPTMEEEPFCLYVGRIHPHKSLELAIMAFKGTDSNKSLIFASDIAPKYMWYKNRLLDLAKRMKIADRFKIILFPSDAEVVRLMQRCSVFLFPSTIDSFGLVVLEAMSCGKPIVACNRGGVPEIVGDSGFLLEPNVEQWRVVVNRLLSDSELRFSMGQKALARSRMFSWQKTAKTLVHTFETRLN